MLIVVNQSLPRFAFGIHSFMHSFIHSFTHSFIQGRTVLSVDLSCNCLSVCVYFLLVHFSLFDSKSCGQRSRERGRT